MYIYTKMDCQDWETVTVRKKKTSTQVKPNERTVANQDLGQIKKFMQNDIVTIKQLSKESRQEIVSHRALRKWTQAQLNQACGFPINTINKIESGQLSPTISQLNTLNRILKTGLKYESSK